jgi:phosphopantothenoylcysteine decarboxylase/phosphopantothenate--cysteine ligase
MELGGPRADALAVVGATPDLISRIVKGLPNDVVSTSVLSFAGPVLLVPDVEGTEGAPLLSNHLDRLAERGLTIHRGEQNPRRLGSAIIRLLLEESSGVPILVTAGGTREPLDPVRYISNYSSGRTGRALAEAARNRGHRVTLMRGPGRDVSTPPGVDEVRVETARDMLSAIQERHKGFPILIMAAAVTDYRPRDFSQAKIRRDRDERELKLTANPDILSSIKDERRDLVTVGFAIEGGLDEAALQGARRKVEAKGLSFVVLNDPQRPDTAFGGPTARARILWSRSEAGRASNVEDLPTLSKEELGREILDRALTALTRRQGIRT